MNPVKKLIIGFLVLLLLFIIVGVVYYSGLRTSNHLYDSLLNTEVKIINHSESIITSLNALKKNENDILHNKDLKNKDLFIKNSGLLGENAKKVRELAEKIENVEIISYAKLIINKNKEYQKAHLESINYLQINGLSHSSGLQGVFQEAALNLADIMEKYSVDDLKIAYLQLRRYEKDFNRTRKLVNKIKWDDALDEYARLLLASNGDIKSIKSQQKGLEVYKVNKENYTTAVNQAKKNTGKLFDKLDDADSAKLIENAINSIYIPQAKDLVLSLRKFEKDYLLRSDVQFMIDVLGQLKKIQDTFKNSSLSEDKINAVNSQIKSYRNAFESLVTNTDKLNINIEYTHKIVKEIEEAGLKIENLSASIISKTSSNATEKVASVSVVAGLSMLLAIVIGCFIAISAIRSIRRTLKDLEDQNWLNNGQAEINNSMRGEQDIDELASTALTKLATFLNMQVGAFYLFANNALKLTASYAYNIRSNNITEFSMGSGLVGQAALERKTLCFKNLSSTDEQLTVDSGIGVQIPLLIMAIPLFVGEKIIGVLLLGTRDEIKSVAEEFIDRMKESIAIAFNSSLMRSNTNELLIETQNQATELSTQQEELRKSNDVLQKKTIEIEEQQKQTELKNVELEEAREDLKQKASDIEKAYKYKTEFLANMSHELRTPLNSLLLFSETLAANRSKNLNKKQIDQAQAINGCGKDLLELINDILNLSKIEAGKMEVHIETLLLQNLISYMDANFRLMIENKNVEYKATVKPGLPPAIAVDTQKLHQIIKNLFSNAIKFTHEGCIELILEKASSADANLPNTMVPEEAMVFRVKDSGIGISEDKCETIFNAFQQADGSTSRKYGGTGLGLSITTKLTELLEGFVNVESTVNEGSCFSIYLPMKLDQLEHTEEQLEVVPSGDMEHELSRKKILIIEDDKQFAAGVAHLVESRGFKAFIATTGKEGLSMAQEYRPTAIILDIQLPEMDGYNVLQMLNASEVLSDVPVLVISAYSDEIKAIRHGAVDFISKPVSTDDLHLVLDSIEAIAGGQANKILVLQHENNKSDEVITTLKDINSNLIFARDVAKAIQLTNKEPISCMVIDNCASEINIIESLNKIKDIVKIVLPPVVVLVSEKIPLEELSPLEKLTKDIVIKNDRFIENLRSKVAVFVHKYGKSRRTCETIRAERLQQAGGDARSLPLNTTEVSIIDENTVQKKIKPNTKPQNPDRDGNGQKQFSSSAGNKSIPTATQAVVAQVKNSTGKDIISDGDIDLEGKIVLLAEDDPRSSFAMTQRLEEYGVQVIQAFNGKEAITELSNSEHIDIVLMDIMMPEMNGFEAMRAIRDETCPDNKIPIFALTAKAMEDDKKECIDAGANEYLSKPVDFNRLVSLMNNWTQH